MNSFLFILAILAAFAVIVSETDRMMRRHRPSEPEIEPPPSSEFHRPVEWGPLLPSMESVERIRTAIYRDQMHSLRSSRFKRWTDAQVDQFIDHWAVQWSDSVGWLTRPMGIAT